MSHLTSANSIFLVEFRGQAQHFIFNSDPEELGKLIASWGKHGIDCIKRYQPDKGNFKKLTKDQVYQWFNYDTYSIEQLKSKNFIK